MLDNCDNEGVTARIPWKPLHLDGVTDAAAIITCGGCHGPNTVEVITVEIQCRWCNHMHAGALLFYSEHDIQARFKKCIYSKSWNSESEFPKGMN